MAEAVDVMGAAKKLARSDGLSHLSRSATQLRSRVAPRLGLRSRSLLIGLITASLLMGCGKSSGPQRVAVDGAIVSSDKLIPNGTIRFLPEPGNNGPVAIVTVTDGLYRFTNENGPYPGKYKAAVNLELDYSVLVKMSSSTSEPPRMNWEEAVTVPDQKRATLHFYWPDKDSDNDSPPNEESQH